MSKPRLIRIEDHEGSGSCSACQREGLRWIAVLTDGSRVGLECMKRITGRSKPQPVHYEWLGGFELVAEYDDYGHHFALWQSKSSSATRTTQNGSLVAIGCQREAWAARGWL